MIYLKNCKKILVGICACAICFSVPKGTETVQAAEVVSAIEAEDLQNLFTDVEEYYLWKSEDEIGDLDDNYQGPGILDFTFQKGKCTRVDWWCICSEDEDARDEMFDKITDQAAIFYSDDYKKTSKDNKEQYKWEDASWASKYVKLLENYDTNKAHIRWETDIYVPEKAPETKRNDKIAASVTDIESTVLDIREKYNTMQDLISAGKCQEADNGDGSIIYEYENLKKIRYESGYNGIDYYRDYYYCDEKLFFVFMWKDMEEHRLYYENDILFRYIDKNRTTFDEPTRVTDCPIENIVNIDCGSRG